MGEPLVGDLGFLLSRVSGLVVRVTNTALAAHVLRVRQYSVLALACEADPGITQRELADVLGLDPSQMVLLVDELAAAGFVERRASDVDRRTRIVVATEAGRQVRQVAERDAAAAVEVPLGPLHPAERDLLRDLLTRIWAATDPG